MSAIADIACDENEMHILLADDEPMIAHLVALVLKGDGHIVDTAGDGNAALEAFRENSVGYDLLLTDLSMPGLNGLALAREVKTLRPAQKVALMTGSADSSARYTAVDYVLPKPLDFDALKQILADLKA